MSRCSEEKADLFSSQRGLERRSEPLPSLQEAVELIVAALTSSLHINRFLYELLAALNSPNSHCSPEISVNPSGYLFTLGSGVCFLSADPAVVAAAHFVFYFGGQSQLNVGGGASL